MQWLLGGGGSPLEVEKWSEGARLAPIKEEEKGGHGDRERWGGALELEGEVGEVAGGGVRLVLRSNGLGAGYI